MLSFVGALVGSASAQGPAKDDKLDLVFKGELKADDPKDKVTKQPSKVHTVKLKGGQAYVITLDALDKGLDPFLRVEDSAGKELAKDDDSGGFPNARIPLTLKDGDDYRLIATAYEGTGKYVLRVRAGSLTQEQKLADQAGQLSREAQQLILAAKPLQALEKLKAELAIRERLCTATHFPDGYPELALNLDLLGMVLNSLGQAGKALPYVERSLAITEKLFPPARFSNGNPDLAGSLNNLGMVLSSLGQRTKALHYFERALGMTEKLYPVTRFPDGHPRMAHSLNNMGFGLNSLGQPSRALPYYERAAAMFEKLYSAARFPNGHPHLAASLSNVGAVLNDLGQPSKALPYHLRAVAMFEMVYPAASIPDGQPEMPASFTLMGVCLKSLGQSRKALPYFQRALAMREKLYPAARFPDGHPHLAMSLDNLGVVLNDLGQAREALHYHDRALAMVEKLYPAARFPDGHPTLAGSLINLGSVHIALGKDSEAFPHLERALAIQHRILRRESMLAAESQALELTRSYPATSSLFLSLTENLPDEPGQRFYSPLWESKALLTRILQRRHEATRVAALKDEGVKKTWLRLGEVRRELGGLALADPTKVKDRDELLRALTDEKEKLEFELAKALPELERPKLLAKVGPKDLADKLPMDAVLLDFIRYQFHDKARPKELRYMVFVLAPKREARMVFLHAAQPIDDAIRDWRQAIDRREQSKAPEVLTMLIWDKIAPRLPKEAKTLYIAPDGDLTRLPFAALPGKGKDTVLLEDYLICHVPHAPFVLEQLYYPPDFTKTSSAMLAIGDVRYDLNNEAKPWLPLQATGPEITQIARLDPKRDVRALTGGEATVASVLKQLPEVGYAHFATHGFFDAKALADERKRVDELLKHWEFRAEGTQRRGLGLRNPLTFTGLVLAGANARQKAGKDGGILSSEAIVDLPLDGLRLAVLSACETGLGELTEGEGVQGLQRAFHLAGCPHVIASLWQVNDEATAALMTLFYRNHWEKKLDAAEALRQAQLTIYRNPTASQVAKKRGIDFRETDLPKVSETVSGPRSPTAHWAAFTFSGVQIKGK